MELKEYLDINKLNKHIKNKYVSVRKSGVMRVYNYTNHCQYDSKFDDVTIKTRGLITYTNKSNNEIIIATGWKKFFTIEQLKNGYGLIDDEIDNKKITNIKFDINKYKNKTGELTDKLDGSLAIIYNDYNDNKLKISTRGSFESNQAILGTKLLQKYLSKTNEKAIRDLLNKNYTLLFEIIGKDNPIVLPYKENEIRYLGATKLHKNGDLENIYVHESIDKFIPSKVFNTTDVINKNMPLSDALTKKVSDKKEGFVWKDKTNAFKIKGEMYLTLSHLLQELNGKKFFELYKNAYIKNQKIKELETLRNFGIVDMKVKELDKLVKTWDKKVSSYYDYVNSFNKYDLSLQDFFPNIAKNKLRTPLTLKYKKAKKKEIYVAILNVIGKEIKGDVINCL